MAATEQELFSLLQELNIETTTYPHAAVFTVEQSRELCGEIPGCHCKSLFLKDKKNNFVLVVMDEDRRLDMKALFKSGGLSVGRLSFASSERMVDMLGISPGSVTPFSLINVDHDGLIVVLDKEMLEHEYLNYHPLHNEATTTIHRDDLIKFIEHFGFKPTIIDFDQL